MKRSVLFLFLIGSVVLTALGLLFLPAVLSPPQAFSYDALDETADSSPSTGKFPTVTYVAAAIRNLPDRPPVSSQTPLRATLTENGAMTQRAISDPNAAAETVALLKTLLFSEQVEAMVHQPMGRLYYLSIPTETDQAATAVGVVIDYIDATSAFVYVGGYRYTLTDTFFSPALLIASLDRALGFD